MKLSEKLQVKRLGCTEENQRESSLESCKSTSGLSQLRINSNKRKVVASAVLKLLDANNERNIWQ